MDGGVAWEAGVVGEAVVVVTPRRMVGAGA